MLTSASHDIFRCHQILGGRIANIGGVRALFEELLVSDCHRYIDRGHGEDDFIYVDSARVGQESNALQVMNIMSELLPVIRRTVAATLDSCRLSLSNGA